MKTEQQIKQLLAEVMTKHLVKNQFSGYSDMFCIGYRTALEDALEFKRSHGRCNCCKIVQEYKLKEAN